MRKIMLAVTPKWARLILEGIKKDEVRKTFPNCELPCEVFLYVTKGKDLLLAYEEYDRDSMSYYGTQYALITRNPYIDNRKPPKEDDEDYSLYKAYREMYRYYSKEFKEEEDGHERILNGKVVAKFTLNKIERVKVEGQLYEQHSVYKEPGSADDYIDEWENSFQKRTCVTAEQLEEYVGRDYDMHVCLWHIDGLRIFGKPKELSEFNKPDVPTYEQSKPLIEMIRSTYTEEDYREDCKRLGYCITKAPQSWCYAEVEE